MYFSDSITLRAITTTLDSYGGPIEAYTDTVAFADKKSATRSEFYQANVSGIKIAIVFSVHAEDYTDQQVILYNSAQYNVARVYAKGEGTVELNCTVREVD